MGAHTANVVDTGASVSATTFVAGGEMPAVAGGEVPTVTITTATVADGKAPASATTLVTTDRALVGAAALVAGDQAPGGHTTFVAVGGASASATAVVDTSTGVNTVDMGDTTPIIQQGDFDVSMHHTDIPNSSKSPVGLKRTLFISMDKNSIVDHYNSPNKRDRVDAESPESRHNKVHIRSISGFGSGLGSKLPTHSHSPTLAVPGTNISTEGHSPSHVSPPSPSDEQDFQGASRATGGISRGRASGNFFNLADSHAMAVDDSSSYNQKGKVLLYTNREQKEPAMTIMHETVGQLPPILHKLSRKFSPVRSK